MFFFSLFNFTILFAAHFTQNKMSRPSFFSFLGNLSTDLVLVLEVEGNV